MNKDMKKILLLIAIMLSHFFNLSAQDSKVNQLFKELENLEGITSIKVTKPMFGMLNEEKDSDLDDLKELFEKLDGVQILMFDNAKNNSSLKNNLVNTLDNISSKLSTLHYKEILNINSKTNKLKFLANKTSGDYIDDLVLKIGEGSKAMFVKFDGKIKSSDLNTIVSRINKIETDLNESPKIEISGESIYTKKNQAKTSDIVEVERKVPSFNSVSAGTGIKVFFTQTNEQSVVVMGESEQVEYVKTEVKNGDLNIYIENPKGKRMNFSNLLVLVKTPIIKAVKTSSGSSFNTTNEVKGDDFSLEASSGSSLKGNFKAKSKMKIEVNSGSDLNIEMTAPTLELQGTSGSNATLQGTTESAVYKTSSAAKINAQNLKAKNVVVNASSAANIEVFANESLNVNASSGANVKFEGSPKNIVTNNSSGGTVKVKSLK